MRQVTTPLAKPEKTSTLLLIFYVLLSYTSYLVLRAIHKKLIVCKTEECSSLLKTFYGFPENLIGKKYVK